MESSLLGVFSNLQRKLMRRSQDSAAASDSQFASRRILFVSHEATRTGAPKIILNVLKHFHEKTNTTLHTILHDGGLLIDQFAQYSDVDCLSIERELSPLLSKKIRKICMRFRENPPLLAICNSMESRFIAYELHQLSIPLLFLLHELPSSYEDDDYRRVYDCSQRVIFPVNSVRDAAHAKVPIPSNKGLVLPQGLLNDEFGTGLTRSEARAQIRRELSLPPETYLVLGCGTLDLRKGIDHFAAVARFFLTRTKMPAPVHFVWLGDGPRWTHSPFHYVCLDIRHSPAKGHVHFIGERENVEPYFLGADTFVLTSRVDPFPCVIHEAMAADLPIIAFDQSGGAAEAIYGGAGIVTPYGDHQTMAEMIKMLLTQPDIADGLRRRAREKVTTKYRFNQYANQLIRLAEETARCQLANTHLEESTLPEATGTHPASVTRRAA